MAFGWVAGKGTAPKHQRFHLETPLQALGSALRRPLESPPCLIGFSGGLDSSLVLAVAVAVSRRECLDPPIPVTLCFPSAPESDEEYWQRLVIDHLKLDDWIRITLGSELDLVGPVAAGLLLRHGVVWPPMLYRTIPVLEKAKGGTLLTGEGGDNVFGAARITALTRILRGDAPSTDQVARQLAKAMMPRLTRWRRKALGRPPRATVPWLTQSASRAYQAMRDRRDDAMPFSWNNFVRAFPQERAVQLALQHNQPLIAAELRAKVSHPLLEGRFIEALSKAGGLFGYTSRSQALSILFPGLLPQPLYERTTKARFDGTAFNAHSREFVLNWRGLGLDPDLVDANALRTEWQKPFPNSASFGLLQAAWLAKN